MRMKIARLWSFLRTESGQAIAEYALVLAFVALVATSALTALGLTISGSLQNLVDSWP